MFSAKKQSVGRVFKRSMGLLSICVLLLSCVFLSSCKNHRGVPQLAVTTSSWSGWSQDYAPKIGKYVYEAVPHLTIQFPEQDSPRFSIIDVSASEIRIQSDVRLSPRGESGRINLLSEQRDFVIPYGESITLVTCTFDAGLIYTFTYLP